MTGNEAQALAIQIAELRATLVTRLDNLVTDNIRGEAIHVDHEQRLRSLEKVRWLVVGFAFAIGGSGGAVASRLLG